jgi:hypothetical protein
LRGGIEGSQEDYRVHEEGTMENHSNNLKYAYLERTTLSMMIHSYDFKDQDEYRASFNRLSKLVFGIDFEAWYQKGAWDDRYNCHSIVADILIWISSYYTTQFLR